MGANALNARSQAVAPERHSPVDNHRASRDAGDVDIEDSYRDAMQAYTCLRCDSGRPFGTHEWLAPERCHITNPSVNGSSFLESDTQNVLM